MLFHWLERFSEDLDFNFSTIDVGIIWEILRKANYIFTSKATPFWQRYTVEYWADHCIVDFAKYLYKTDPKYTIQIINWASVKVFDLEQNFAHKLCAFYERKKGRDVYDINFYLKKWVLPDRNILIERHNKEFSFFIKELIIEMNKPYLEKNIIHALQNLDYAQLSLESFKKDLFQNLNRSYLEYDFDLNLSYKKQIQDGIMSISLTNDLTLFNKAWDLVATIRCDYALMNAKREVVYQTNSLDKMNTYIYTNILSPKLQALDTYRVRWFYFETVGKLRNSKV